MSADPSSNVTLEVNDQDLSNIMGKVENGAFRIPEFQREYVWDASDVVDLFDSIYRNYPVGSVFLWRVPDDMRDFFRDVRDFDQPEIEAMPFSQVSFVLDGQQRLTSLYVALRGLEFNGYDYEKIVFDLDDEEFRRASDEPDHLVSISDIWDQSERFSLISELSSDRAQTLQMAADRLTNYELPLIIVESEDIDRVIEIFERINQKGTNLSRFDIVNANVWSEDFNLRLRIQQDIQDRLSDIGFGEIDRGTVTQALALNIRGACTTGDQKDLDSEEVKFHWEETSEAIIGAVRYLRNQLNIQRSEFIPYEGMIPVLAYYFYETGNTSISSEHKEQVDRWFWRVAVSNHWDQKTQTRMGEDRSLFDEIISGNDVSIDYPPAIDAQKLTETNIKRTTSKVRNAFLCVLANKNPKRFDNGGEIDLSEKQYVDFRLDKHHIFPNSYLNSRDVDISKRKSITDITFLPSDLNRDIGDIAPSIYMEDYRSNEDFEEIMKSHLIPVSEGSAIWEDNYEEFLEERAKMVMEEIHELIGGVEDIGESSIDKVEKTYQTLYDLIDRKLAEAEGGSYWGSIPGDIQGKVSERVDDIDDLSDREKLDWVTPTESATIISLHWDQFKNIFPSRASLEDYSEDLEQYENMLETDGADDFVELNGELAIQWINGCIETAEG